MIRERDAGLPCISCGRLVPLDAGHFISVREAPGLRFQPWNINGQCRHENGYKGGRTWEYGRGLDLKYGEETAEFLKALLKTANISLDDLLYLTDAARHAFNVYFQAYRERFPSQLLRAENRAGGLISMTHLFMCPWPEHWSHSANVDGFMRIVLELMSGFASFI
jgi:hypothetical protein